MDVASMKRRIAERIWQLRGGDDIINWHKAEEILNHFLDRQPDDPDWVANDEDWRPLFKDIIYG